MMTIWVTIIYFNVCILLYGLSVSKNAQRPPEFRKYRKWSNKNLLTALHPIITPVKFGMTDITDPNPVAKQQKQALVYKYTKKAFYFPEFEQYCWNSRLCMEAMYHFATVKYKDEMKSEEFAIKLVMTASYHLCSMTNQRSKRMELVEGHRCFTPHEQAKYYIVAQEYMENVPFRCATRYFCPDPCFKHAENAISEHCKNCKTVPRENTNIEGLRFSYFNVTDCGCDEHSAWSNEARRCHRIRNECTDKINQCVGDAICDDQHRGYKCTCKRGYHLVQKYRQMRQICVRNGEKEEEEIEEFGEVDGYDFLEDNFKGFDKLTNKQLISELGKHLKLYKFESYDMTDERGEGKEGGELLTRFPKKVVRMPQIEKYCPFDGRKPRQCMEAILQLRTHTWRQEFRDEEFAFTFNTVANYHLCWYTLRRLSAMQHAADDRCFTWAEMKKYLFPININSYWFNNKIPFECSTSYFCPHVCGAHKNCKDCRYQLHHNNELYGIKRNLWNYTCSCPTNAIWNEYTHRCQELFNECKEGTHDCAQNAYCRDKDFSYNCVCDRGFHIEERNRLRSCIKDNKTLNIGKLLGKSNPGNNHIQPPKKEKSNPGNNHIQPPKKGVKDNLPKYNVWLQSSTEPTFLFRFNLPSIIVLYSLSILLTY